MTAVGVICSVAAVCQTALLSRTFGQRKQSHHAHRPRAEEERRAQPHCELRGIPASKSRRTAFDQLVLPASATSTSHPRKLCV
jgi:hypothetical protein